MEIFPLVTTTPMNAIATFVTTIARHELAFLLILTRIAAFVVAIPLLGGGGTPPYVKGLLVLAMTFVLFPVVRQDYPPPTPFHEIDIWMFMADLLLEILVGLIIGFGVRAVFAAVEIGSEVTGMQMGFGLANAFDPMSNQHVSLMRQVHIVLISLLFLSVYGHHLVLRALAASFDLIPVAGLKIHGGLIEQVIRVGSQMFILGLKIAAPVMIVLILAQMAMGVISRVIPQIQIFLISFPLTIGLGLIVLGLSLSLYTSVVRGPMTVDSKLPDLLMEMKSKGVGRK